MNIIATGTDYAPINVLVFINDELRPDLKAISSSSSLGIDPGDAEILAPQSQTLYVGDYVRIVAAEQTLFYGKIFNWSDHRADAAQNEADVSYYCRDIRCELTEDFVMCNYNYRDPVTTKIIRRLTWQEILTDIMTNWYHGDKITIDFSEIDPVHIGTEHYPRADVMTQGMPVQAAIDTVLSQMGSWATAYLDYGKYHNPNNHDISQNDPMYKNAYNIFLKIISFKDPTRVRNIYHGWINEYGEQTLKDTSLANVGQLILNVDYTSSVTAILAQGAPILMETALLMTPAWDRTSRMSGNPRGYLEDTQQTVEQQVLTWPEKYTTRTLSDDLRFMSYDTTDQQFELEKQNYINPFYRKQYENIGRRYAIGKIDDCIAQSFFNVSYTPELILSGYRILPITDRTYPGGSGMFSGYTGDSGMFIGSGYNVPALGEWQRSPNFESDLVQDYYDEDIGEVLKQKPFILYQTKSQDSGSISGYVWTTKDNGFSYENINGQNYVTFSEPFGYKQSRIIDYGDKGRYTHSYSGAEIVAGYGPWFTYYYDTKFDTMKFSQKMTDAFANSGKVYLYESTVGVIANVISYSSGFVYAPEEQISGYRNCLVFESRSNAYLNFGGLNGRDKGNSWSLFHTVPLAGAPNTTQGYTGIIQAVSGKYIYLDDNYSIKQPLNGMHFWGRHLSGIQHIPWISGTGSGTTSGTSGKYVERLYDESISFAIGNVSGISGSGNTILEFEPDFTQIYDQDQFFIVDPREYDVIPYEVPVLNVVYKSIHPSLLYLENSGIQNMRRVITDKCDFSYEIWNNNYIKQEKVYTDSGYFYPDVISDVEIPLNSDNSILWVSGMYMAPNGVLGANALYQFANERILNKDIPMVKGSANLPYFDIIYKVGDGININDMNQYNLIIGGIKFDYVRFDTEFDLINRKS